MFISASIRLGTSRQFDLLKNTIIMHKKNWLDDCNRVLAYLRYRYT